MLRRRSALMLPALAISPRLAGAQEDWRQQLREVRFG